MLVFVFVIVIVALSAFIELDNVYAGQFMLARPSVTGLILGLCFGNFTLAVQLGIFFEFLYLDNMPMGGIVPPSGVISVTTAFILARFTQADAAFAFLFGVVAGIAFSHIEMKMRNWRSAWTDKIEAELNVNPHAVSKWIVRGLMQQFVAAFVFMLIFVGLALSFINGLWLVLPDAIKSGVKLAYFGIPWIGFTVLLRNLRPKKARQ